MNCLLKTLIVLLLISTGCKTGRTSQRITADQPNPELISGDFRLISVNNQVTDHTRFREEVSVVIDTGNGSLSGFAGCNRFTGSFVLRNDTIRIGLLASTRMACLQMETEEIYLGSLSGQDHLWQVKGDTLRLRNNTATLLFVKRGR